MLKRRLAIGLSVLSIASFGLTSLSYAREAQPSDDRGGQQQVQVADDRGVDPAPHARRGDDNGVDPAPHA